MRRHQGGMSFGPEPTAAELAAAFGLSRTGPGNYNGPCPLCSGDDRFHVQEVDGRAVVGCQPFTGLLAECPRFNSWLTARWLAYPRPLESPEVERPARPCPRQRAMPTPRIPAGPPDQRSTSAYRQLRHHLQQGCRRVARTLRRLHPGKQRP